MQSSSNAFSLSPLDGRYHSDVGHLSLYFSEFALSKERVVIELKYLSALLTFIEAPQNIDHVITYFEMHFSLEDFSTIKSFEIITKHDVKAVEYFLRDYFNKNSHAELCNLVHFGLTSEDVNNLAYSLPLQRYLKQEFIPLLDSLLQKLLALTIEYQDAPFPARTHGQLASPTTAGKEFAVFLSRIHGIYKKIASHQLLGKLNGATGNYSALNVANPNLDWISFSNKFILDLGLAVNEVTTQIESHDSMAELFNLIRQLNNVVIDLNQDLWQYISYGLYREIPKAGEVGSSTMPHKINPINFENSEGNLLYANAILSFFADKLCRSRMQRDLSDSTVLRNLGVPLAHTQLALKQTLLGLNKIKLDPKFCTTTLNGHPELLAEAIQSVLRLNSVTADPYSDLKQIVRGELSAEETRKKLNNYIDSLPLGVATKAELKNLLPASYIGLAPQICKNLIQTFTSQKECKP
ncbi:MAG: adenylosuccinate lyase [Oligoflexia bacterium]|nr:adenylosuccinate lyase [Oligoflexia bacterium]MBF0364657.1 adenylosuccinate lyase [Oligoflexia bacterium]